MSGKNKESQEWTEEGITTTVEPGEQEVFSFFDDDEVGEGQSAYSGVVYLNGKAVRVRELDAAEKAEITRQESELGALMQSIAGANDAAEMQRLSVAIEAAQQALWDKAIGLAVSGWELKRPNGTPVECTAAARKKLRASQKAELYDKIIQRSTMGRDLSRFLSGS